MFSVYTDQYRNNESHGSEHLKCGQYNRETEVFILFNINLVNSLNLKSHIGLMAIIKHCISRQLKSLGRYISCLSIRWYYIFLFGVGNYWINNIVCPQGANTEMEG